VRDLDIIVPDTPRSEVIEILCGSCDLLIFSSKVGSHCDKNTGAAPRGSSSASIGELRSDIDKLDEVGCKGTSA
jgi:hypothetical protein